YFCLPLMAALAGCGPVKPESDAVLEKRSVERWNLLIAHHAEKAYDFLSPGTRSVQTREKYAADKNDTALHWKSVEYVGRTCETNDACTVQLKGSYSANMSARMGHDVNAITMQWERWIRVDGQWFYLADRPTSPVSKGH